MGHVQSFEGAPKRSAGPEGKQNIIYTYTSGKNIKVSWAILRKRAHRESHT